MMNTRVRLIELGLVATLGLTLAAGLAAADRATPAARADDREPNYIYFHDDSNSISRTRSSPSPFHVFQVWMRLPVLSMTRNRQRPDPALRRT